MEKKKPDITHFRLTTYFINVLESSIKSTELRSLFDMKNLLSFMVYFSWNFYTTGSQYSSGCTDQMEFWTCYMWSHRGMCQNRYYLGYMNRNCRRMCGLCPVIPVVATRKRVSLINEEICQDNRDKCTTWKNYCDEGNEYFNFMMKNCRRTCLMCRDDDCQDLNKKCTRYEIYGYCHPEHRYFRYMIKTCSKSCRFCLPTKQNRTFVNLTKQFECDFEKDECDWENEHFEDTADWLVGTIKHGPEFGYNHSKSYLYLNTPYTEHEARLWLPWQLVLPIGGEEMKGTMCMNFMYQLTGGKLSIKQGENPSVTNKFPKPNLLFITKKKTNSWSHAQVTVEVSSRYYLLLNGVKGVAPSFIAVDNIYFTEEDCQE